MDTHRNETPGKTVTPGSDRHWLPAVARCVLRETFTDRVMMVAGGLAFFGIFGLLPAIATAAVIFGLFVDKETLSEQITALGVGVPDEMIELITEFLTAVPSGMGLGIGLAVNLAIVLWTVQRSASGLITALNIVYDHPENRSRFRREAIALAIAVGGIFFVLVSMVLMALLPLLRTVIGDPLADILEFARWPVLALLFMLALGLLYSYAPSRPRIHVKWISAGAVVATLLWLGASILFTLYMAYGGGWGQFYGSVTAAVVLMTWLFIGALAIMVGAETNAQLEARMEGRRGIHLKEELDKRERKD